MAKKKTVFGKDDKDIISNKSKYDLQFSKVNLTQKQKDFLKIAFDPSVRIIFLSGPAGTAKTYSAVYAALQLYNMDPSKEKEIMYMRTIAESGDKTLGSLPGVVEEKINPFLSPLMDKIEEIVSSTSCRMLISDKIVTGMPVNYVRGSSWKDKIVILDEAQNYSVKEVITAITRIGKNTKYFICGDPMQSDINGKSGFEPIAQFFNTQKHRDKGIHVFEFDKSDILRDELLSFIIGELEEFLSSRNLKK